MGLFNRDKDKTTVLMLVSYHDGEYDLEAGKQYKLPHDLAARIIFKQYGSGAPQVEVEVDTSNDQTVPVLGG